MFYEILVTLPGEIVGSVAHPENSVKKFVENTINKYGRLSILVNNAGIMPNSSLTEQSVEEWDQVMAVNLRGPFLMAKHAVPAMNTTRSPVIINIGSIEGISGNPNHSAYMASKAGVHGLTTSMAIDLGPKGIRVNAIAPGWINTELNQGYLEGLSDQKTAQKELGKLHPIGPSPPQVNSMSPTHTRLKL